VSGPLRACYAAAMQRILRRVARGVLSRLNDYRAQRAPAPPPPAPPPPAPEKKPNWELRPPAELVDYIEQHHHAGLRRDLPRLVDTARRLAREHASTAAVGLSDALAELFAELDGHMHKEETMLFPLLRTGTRGGELDMPIRMMERDHDGHVDHLDRIRELTGDFEPPDPAWASLYAELAALDAGLHEHIYLEDGILFARATMSR